MKLFLKPLVKTEFLLICLLAASNSFATTGLPFTSDFETGDFSEWHGGSETSLVVSNSDAASGSYAARSTMVTGTPTDNYKDYYFGDHTNIGGTPPTNGIWLRFYSKFENGFNFGNTDIHKLAIFNFTDENGLRRFQIVLNIYVPNGVYFIENLKWNADRSFGSGRSFSQNVGATETPLRVGEWDKLKLYIRPNTPGVADGIIRMWVNDVLKTEVTNVYMREDSTFNPNKFILSNYVPTTDASGFQWWDNFYIGDSDPDNLVNDPAPNPPILLE